MALLYLTLREDYATFWFADWKSTYLWSATGYFKFAGIQGTIQDHTGPYGTIASYFKLMGLTHSLSHDFSRGMRPSKNWTISEQYVLQDALYDEVLKHNLDILENLIQLFFSGNHITDIKYKNIEFWDISKKKVRSVQLEKILLSKPNPSTNSIKLTITTPKTIGFDIKGSEFVIWCNRIFKKHLKISKTFFRNLVKREKL